MRGNFIVAKSQVLEDYFRLIDSTVEIQVGLEPICKKTSSADKALSKEPATLNSLSAKLLWLTKVMLE